MSFIVKNYDLPQNCGECPCRGYDGRNSYCRAVDYYKRILNESDKPEWCPLADVSEIATVIDCNIYDKKTTIRSCTVQILENTVTGKTSVGWWKEEK